MTILEKMHTINENELNEVLCWIYNHGRQDQIRCLDDETWFMQAANQDWHVLESAMSTDI